MPITSDHLGKLKDFYHRTGRMPSYAELAKLLRFKSKHAVTYWVNKWLDKDLIRRDSTGRLLPGASFLSLRLLGEVRAGFPSPAEEENVDTISLDDWLITNREASFMLKVSGDSMQESGINPGDHVIIERGRSPLNGDIVIAEVDGNWTMKFFEKRNGRIVLMPGNKKYKPIVPEQELKIAGVVTSVIRKYK
jgi:SOS regulatory protein LexA